MEFDAVLYRSALVVVAGDDHAGALLGICRLLASAQGSICPMSLDGGDKDFDPTQRRV